MASKPTPYSGFETLPPGKNWFPRCITWGHHPGSCVTRPARGSKKVGDTGTKQNPADTTALWLDFSVLFHVDDLNH